MTTALSTQTSPALSLLLDPARFDHLQRVGKMLALSPLFPEHLRKGGLEQAVANGALVMNMAYRLNEDPLTVAQSIYFVGGRPGWATTYMIAKANQHGVFRDQIDWDVEGKGDTLGVTAFAVLSKTGRRVQVTCDMEMARKEGWTKNPKYQSIPEQMLRYRSAAFLIRLYCPEVMIGIPMEAEVDLPMRDITPGPEVVAPIVATAEPPIEVKAQPAAEKKPEPEKATKVEAAEEKKDPFASSDVDAEQFRGLLDLMLADLGQSGPDETEEVYAAQIEQLKASTPDLYREWADAVTDAREKSAA